MKVKHLTIMLVVGLILFGKISSVEATTELKPSDLKPDLASNSAFFIENVGQFAPEVRFQLPKSDGAVYLVDDGLWLTQVAAGKIDPLRRIGVNLHVRFVGANPKVDLQPFQAQSTRFSYFLGQDSADWHTDVPAWAGVRYHNLYPGIDLEVMAEGDKLRPRLVVQPGGELDQVRLEVTGADDVQPAGDWLRLTAATGQIDLPLLQVVDHTGADLSVNIARPVIRGSVVMSPFAAGPATPAQPTANGLIYSTFLGGTLVDGGYDVAVDGSNQAYVTGDTTSTTFPTTAGPFNTYQAETDAFVAKLSADGSSLVYGLFLGGSNFDHGDTIVVDSAGNAYVAGQTQSNNFPMVNGSFDTTFNGNIDTFIVKVNPTGTALVYATYLGGNNRDEPGGIAFNANDNTVYVTGLTESINFPVTSGVLDTQLGDIDAFVVRLNAAGTALTYATYLGGTIDEDTGRAIVVDGTGRAYIAGQTFSPDFPVSSGSFDRDWGNGDGFVVRLNDTATALEYGVFIGGDSFDNATGVGIDANGNIYVTGSTQSADFPTTNNVFDRTYNGSDDVFVVRINPAGTGGADLVYGTYLGGSGSDNGLDLTIDSLGNAYFVGETGSTDLPTLPGSFFPTYSGGTDAFLTRLTPGGRGAFVSYLGGTGFDTARAITLDTAGDLYLTGSTGSGNFPTEPGSFDRSYNGSQDAFVTKFVAINPTTLDVDLFVDATQQSAALPNGVGSVLIQYGNLGATTANSIQLMAELDSQLTYNSDTSGVTPTEVGNTLTWDLPSADYLEGGSFSLSANVPDLLIEADYPITLTITSAGPEGDPGQNTLVTAVRLNGPVFLPLIRR